MTTIPARLAQASKTSRNFTEARRSVLSLYRDWYRSAPEIVEIYGLDVSPAFIRHTIRQKFEANRYVHDVRAIDVMVHKGRLEYQETMNCWKQPDHVLDMLQNKSRPQRTFLQKFYEGRDEDAIVPAASGVL